MGTGYDALPFDLGWFSRGKEPPTGVWQVFADKWQVLLPDRVDSLDALLDRVVARISQQKHSSAIIKRTTTKSTLANQGTAGLIVERTIPNRCTSRAEFVLAQQGSRVHVEGRRYAKKRVDRRRFLICLSLAALCAILAILDVFVPAPLAAIGSLLSDKEEDPASIVRGVLYGLTGAIMWFGGLWYSGDRPEMDRESHALLSLIGQSIMELVQGTEAGQSVHL